MSMRHISFCVILYSLQSSQGGEDKQKADFCDKLICDDKDNKEVCGLRTEEEGVRVQLFENECKLLQYGCTVTEKDAYGIINMEYCNNSQIQEIKIPARRLMDTKGEKKCVDCTKSIDTENVCGLRNDGSGFRVRLFTNKCELDKYNCENSLEFNITELYICNGMYPSENIQRRRRNYIDDYENSTLADHLNVTDDVTDYLLRKTNEKTPKNLVLVDASMFNYNGNINDTIDNFFAGTHIFDLPVKDVTRNVLRNTRRLNIKIAGPVKIFQPWVDIPKNITFDDDHNQTLQSCFHKCPRKCPVTYAPVCGMPGLRAREPAVMFQNHCHMDMAQCKMRREDASDTAASSAYIESAFIVCLGDTLNGIYRFLPLIRTLQHMGRLKRKGHFHHRMRNFGMFNELLIRQPKVNG